VKILIVEDEERVAASLRQALAEECYDVLLSGSVEEARDLLQCEQVDLIILDRILPGQDGVELLRKLRDEHDGTMVLMLTAKDSLQDRVEGLESGADDYLTKPFALTELVARVHALLRRGTGEKALHLSIADLVLDRVGKRASRGERRIELTDREFQILEYLMLCEGRPATREMITRHVWGYVPATPTNVVAVHINALRRKIDGEGKTSLIHSVRGMGYMVREDPP